MSKRKSKRAKLPPMPYQTFPEAGILSILEDRLDAVAGLLELIGISNLDANGLPSERIRMARDKLILDASEEADSIKREINGVKWRLKRGEDKGAQA